MQTSKQIADKNQKSPTKALPTKVSPTLNNQNSQETYLQIEELFQVLRTQISNHSNQIDRLNFCKQLIEQLDNFQYNSRVLTAIVEAASLNLKYINQPFCQLIGISHTQKIETKSNIKLNELFSNWKNTEIEQLYRIQILPSLFKQIYKIDTEKFLFPNESVISTINYLPNSNPHYIKFWFCSGQLKITRINQKVDEFADFNFQSMSTSDCEAWLTQPGHLEILAQKLNLENYQIEGFLLLEGIDVTATEKMRQLTQLLGDRESLIQLDKFKQVEQYLCSLFDADDIILLRNEGEKQLKLFIGSEYLTTASYPKIYSLQSLQDSPILKTANQNQVKHIPDLQQNCPTECEQYLSKQGVNSLLLIPLVIKPDSGQGEVAVEEVLGIVGLTSHRPNNFKRRDYRQAQELIPALITAVRQTIQQRFTNIRNIHPAVEWRFLQEAERRSWGLPPEAIIFEDVYPLYAICDIRGSSAERNRAIQADLLEQFRLGLDIVEAFCQAVDSAFSQQLRQDILEYTKSLEEKVSVDTEITALYYLRSHLELYFDHFVESGDRVKAAVEAYLAACENEHSCVYQARDRYDQMLYKINHLLQSTWEKWQQQMQKIIPHHCDFEATDGIDHMIYVGKSINSKFNQFHLCSLRYEQLRAVCDCARTALTLKAESEEAMLGVVHLILVQNATIDIYHNESTERLFDVKGSRDIRYEIVKKRIDKGVDQETKERITQPGMLTVVYSTDEEWQEYQQYLRYLVREGWVEEKFESGLIEPLQGVSGLRFIRVKVLLPA